jgi:ABC-type molybdate transport system substrate-binding protein
VAIDRRLVRHPRASGGLGCIACVCLLAASVAWGQKPTGTIAVLYAGSLGTVIEKGLSPAIERATGYGIEGEGHGSVAAARMIRDRLRAPDVFVSADPAVNTSILMGPKNRNLVEWYLTIAAADLVIGYNPKSRVKDDLEQARAGKVPWYEVLARSGVKLGRTDPEPGWDAIGVQANQSGVADVLRRHGTPRDEGNYDRRRWRGVAHSCSSSFARRFVRCDRNRPRLVARG